MSDEKELCRIRYETLHFGFPAESVLLGVKEMVLGAIKDNISDLQASVVKKSPHESEQIKAAAEILVDEYTAESIKPLEMAEKQIRQCFSIPDHVLLPGDEIQRQQFTRDEEIALNKKLENLKFRYKRAIFTEKMLQAEKKVFDELGQVEFEIMKLQKLPSTGRPSDLIEKLLKETTSLNLTPQSL